MKGKNYRIIQNEKEFFALVSVAQWIECQPLNQRVAGSIPGLGCGPGSQWGARERQSHIDVSLPLSLFPFPSLKINKILKKKMSLRLY